MLMTALNAQEGAQDIIKYFLYGLVYLVLIVLALTALSGLVRNPGLLLLIPGGAIVIGFFGTAITGNVGQSIQVGAILGALWAVFAAFQE